MRKASFSLVLACCLAGAQRYPADVEIVGHVLQPKPAAPTAERLEGLKMPDGFRLTKFAGLQNPRIICVNTDGTVYVSQREPGNVVMLKDTDGDGVADVQRVVFKRRQAHGLAIRNNRLYVVTIKELYSATILPDGTLGPSQLHFDDLPDGGQHPNRTMAFSPDGDLMLSVGSTTNAAYEHNPELAALLRVNLSDMRRTVFASGLRNTIGFDWHPQSGRFFGFDHGIDWLGNDSQKEELNELLEDKRYGWPFIFEDGKQNPQDEPPAPYTMEWWAQNSESPLLTYDAHAAPMQFLFYRGTKFPEEFRGSGFATMRGSWNRNPPSGYEVVRVKFGADGTPSSIEPFLAGFLVKEGDSYHHLGRLVGLAEMPDGSLLLGDDTNNILYRLAYQQELQTMPDQAEVLAQTHGGETKFAVRSGSFADGGTIPELYSEYGEGRSPSLEWDAVPEGTQSIVIVCEDPDAHSPKPFVHWMAANLPPTMRSLPEGIKAGDRPAELQGIHGAGHASVVGYFGPKPPAGDPPHAYHFQVFALDKRLDLPPGFTKAALMKAMEGSVLGSGSVIGRFGRLSRTGG